MNLKLDLHWNFLDVLQTQFQKRYPGKKGASERAFPVKRAPRRCARTSTAASTHISRLSSLSTTARKTPQKRKSLKNKEFASSTFLSFFSTHAQSAVFLLEYCTQFFFQGKERKNSSFFLPLIVCFT